MPANLAKQWQGRYTVAMENRDEKAKSPRGGDITAAQCKMARAALGLGIREIADAAQVSTNTVTRLERGETLYPRTLQAIRAALEAAGVEFIAENGGGQGVRLRKVDP